MAIQYSPARIRYLGKCGPRGSLMCQVIGAAVVQYGGSAKHDTTLFVSGHSHMPNFEIQLLYQEFSLCASITASRSVDRFFLCKMRIFLLLANTTSSLINGILKRIHLKLWSYTRIPLQCFEWVR